MSVLPNRAYWRVAAVHCKRKARFGRKCASQVVHCNPIQVPTRFGFCYSKTSHALQVVCKHPLCSCHGHWRRNVFMQAPPNVDAREGAN